MPKLDGQLTPLPEPGALVVGKYRVETMVGRGAMGVVYAAHHEMLDEKVALKILDPEVASIPEAAARFVNEARISARVRSEHVCSILDVGYYEETVPYIAMEYIEGENLDEILQRRGRLEVLEAIEVALQTLRGVAHAHALGVVHRDLKPANLMVRPDGDGRFTVKIVDFGVSKASMGSELTRAGSMLGSPTHMAPEQIRDSRAVDPRADIWAMGVILYELFTGELPFDAEGPGEVLRLVLETEPVRPRALCSALSLELDALVMRCLEQNPEMRFETARDLITALETARDAWRDIHDNDDATVVAPMAPVTALAPDAPLAPLGMPRPLAPVWARPLPAPPPSPSTISTIPPASLVPTSRSEAPAAHDFATGFRHAALACAAVVAAGLVVIFAFFANRAAYQVVMGPPSAAASPEGTGEVTGVPVVPPPIAAPIPAPPPSARPASVDAGVPPSRPLPSRSASHVLGAHPVPRGGGCPAGLVCTPTY